MTPQTSGFTLSSNRVCGALMPWHNPTNNFAAKDPTMEYDNWSPFMYRDSLHLWMSLPYFIQTCSSLLPTQLSTTVSSSQGWWLFSLQYVLCLTLIQLSAKWQTILHSWHGQMCRVRPSVEGIPGQSRALPEGGAAQGGSWAWTRFW
jgi:hypothetical protein